MLIYTHQFAKDKLSSVVQEPMPCLSTRTAPAVGTSSGSIDPLLLHPCDLQQSFNLFSKDQEERQAYGSVSSDDGNGKDDEDELEAEGPHELSQIQDFPHHLNTLCNSYLEQDKD